MDLHRAHVRVGRAGVQDLRGEGGSPEPRSIGRLPDQDQEVRLALRGLRNAAAQDPVDRRDAERHDVDQAVVVVARVEADVPAEIGNAQGVAVLPDPPDDTPRDRAARLAVGPVQVAESEAVQDPDHVGPHAVDIPDDSADSRRSPLDREELRGVIVTLVGDHERPTPPVDRAKIDDPCIFPGPQDHVGRERRQQAPQESPTALVGAVLAVGHVEEERLGHGQVASQPADHLEELVGFRADSMTRELGTDRFSRDTLEADRFAQALPHGVVSTRWNTASRLRRKDVTSNSAARPSSPIAARTSGSASSRARKESPASHAAIA